MHVEGQVKYVFGKTVKLGFVQVIERVTQEMEYFFAGVKS